MQRKDFLMSFDAFRITAISFIANPEFKRKGAVNIKTNLETSSDFNENARVLRVKIKVASVDAVAAPFAFSVEGEGEFGFLERPDEEALANCGRINGPAIIFPYIRETLADLTRRAGFPPLHLAPVNFMSLAEKRGEIQKTPLKESKK